MNEALGFIAWSLLHAVWLGFGLALLFVLLGWLVRGQRRHETLYVAGCAALVLCVVLPPAVSWWQLQERSGTLVLPFAATESTPASPNATLADEAFAITVETKDAAVDPVWPRLAVALWAAGVVLLGLRHCVAWVSAQRLSRRGLTDDTVLPDARFQLLAGRIQLEKLPRCFASSLVPAPCVVGWVRPVVLIPVGLLRELSGPQLEALVLHELAHIRRHDYAVNLLQRLVETLLFFHPAVWWLSRRVRVHREFCCDALVVQATHGPKHHYAKALSRAAEHVTASEPADASEGNPLMPTTPRPALAATDADLPARVKQLVDPAATPRPPRTLAAVGVTALLLLSLSAATVGLAACRGESKLGGTANEQDTDSDTPRRVVRVDWPALLAGDMRLNVVVRPGDTVVVPEVERQFVYIAGKVDRPGTYAVPGKNRLTIKQVFVAAGGNIKAASDEQSDLAALLIRRTEQKTNDATEQPGEIQHTVRLPDLFNGRASDMFLAGGDLLRFDTRAAIEADGLVVEAKDVELAADKPLPILELPVSPTREPYPDAELVQPQDLAVDETRFRTDQPEPDFHVIASMETKTRAGTYDIPRPNFRLLQAVALAGGVPDGTEAVYVIRAGEGTE